MKNLNEFGVQEMNSLEITEINGGDQGYRGGYIVGAVAGTVAALAVSTVRMLVQIL
ncbi:hypothetical protein U6A24_06280 [Aquimarina gracilis]|uniref:Class IIb bacteriocin, lactobin A/cerein 7B family n=1 Tax=Aquimarina gracilis TaxID=874422 RepID=A0ABU5ZSU6_9FLAO|nr:hypothetical protein [Aquimarina gracilis]MEB3345058.1 hypothetical protein [Aquimarina gracilis]